MRVSRDQSALEVLVVDDDPDIRDLLAEFFRGRGLSCATAHDGRAATRALEQSGSRFGLVLTDIAMPGADGFAVLAAAHMANPYAYVVMITGYSGLDSAIQAVRAGAQDYLTKPFALGQLDVILSRVTANMRDRCTDTAGAIDTRLGALESRMKSLEASLTSIDTTLGQILERLGKRTRPH